ncbi:MAG: TIGR03564 family F420-dependent LLM class oxidoreductase [Deltaproteobacteria bacterium]|nr:TIGR03564 family F420-dependent LLM class oxidoreductase [Deltaproteobacteria bacterium]
MRIGMMIGEGAGESPHLDDIIARAQLIEKAGLSTAWMANIFAYDAIGLLGIVGRETKRIELGTAVVPTYPRHPAVMAQQALTTQAASNGRFTLGIGLSHQIVIENMFGLSYKRTLSHMREYLSVLKPLLAGEPVKYRGEEYQVNMSLNPPAVIPVPIVMAALGPKMLELCGREATGTITWMAGRKALSEHVVPRITNAAKEAKCPPPRVIAGVPLAIVNDVAAARTIAAKVFHVYRDLPAYRTMLDRGDAAEPIDVALIGNSATIKDEIKRWEDIGITDLCAFVFRAESGSFDRTIDFLGSL